MQPITQGSLDPKLKDIRHLRAEQSLLGAVGWLGLAILHRGTERVLRCGEGAWQRAFLPDVPDFASLPTIEGGALCVWRSGIANTTPSISCACWIYLAKNSSATLSSKIAPMQPRQNTL
jgi:hypothetical protein